jgi:hypothetical protein
LPYGKKNLTYNNNNDNNNNSNTLTSILNIGFDID